MFIACSWTLLICRIVAYAPHKLLLLWLGNSNTQAAYSTLTVAILVFNQQKRYAMNTVNGKV